MGAPGVKVGRVGAGRGGIGDPGTLEGAAGELAETPGPGATTCVGGCEDLD